MMNRKALFEDINPMYLLLGFLAGLIGLIVTSRMEGLSVIFKGIIFVVCFVGAYFYLRIVYGD